MLMKMIGITGGVGAGKSELLKHLTGKPGVLVRFADNIAHDLMEKGKPLFNETVELLGKEILTDEGSIDRGKMAKLIFSSPELKRKADSLIHPAVKDYILADRKKAEKSGKYSLYFLEAALLIECGYDKICDELWYIYADEAVRRKRLKNGRGYSYQKTDSIMGSQLKEEVFREKCSRIIDNSGDLDKSIEYLDGLVNGYIMFKEGGREKQSAERNRKATGKGRQSMQSVKKSNEPLVFGLDIGTRSIVGTVGYYQAKQFHVVALEKVEHEDRVMLDGQIHDIAGVAQEIRTVKKWLEDDIGQTLTDVCIAAAGRVLRTVTTHVEQEFNEERDVTPEDVYSLEVLGAQQAYAEFVKNNDLRIHFYCVGYTVERYYLNKYPMGSLESHKGHNIGADMIATFLPDEVVDGLYKAVEAAGLKVANLTLEPIAAMEVAIPKSYRMLNIALVDVGAGTSDICITRDEAIIAYGMIPSAGDEITECIAKALLTDFNEAEEIKKQIGDKGAIKYHDIMGIESKLDQDKADLIVRPTIEIMTREISDKIKKLNGGKPVSAVFVVGGGGRVPLFCKLLANEMGLMEERVAVRGEEVLKSVDFQVKDINIDSLLVTPVGICLNFYSSKNNFVFVSFNGEQVKLYDSSNLRISDAAMQSGFSNSDLFPKHGPDISFTVNGRTQLRRGSIGEAAEIRLNGIPVSISEKIKGGDIIEVIPSTAGKAASVQIEKLPEFGEKITVNVNGRPVVLPKYASVNGELQSGYYEIQNGDKIEMLKYYTVQQILEFMDVNLESGTEVYVNREIASPLTEVYDNFSVEWTFAEEYHDGSLSDLKARSAKAKENGVEDNEGAEVSASIDDLKRRISGEPETNNSPVLDDNGEPIPEASSNSVFGYTSAGNFDTAAVDAIGNPIHGARINGGTIGSGPGITKDVPVEQLKEEGITVFYNDAPLNLKGKNSYIFVDIFNFVDFDLSAHKGKTVETLLNGRAAQYTEPIKEGDRIEVRWKDIKA